MDKVQQYTTTVRCRCPGHPAISGKTGRIKCERYTDVEVTEFHPKKQQLQLQAGLEKAQWKRLRTMGQFQRLCPSCSKLVLKMRAESKLKWG